LIVTIWSCGCQRVSGEHNGIDEYSFIHGQGSRSCTCRPFVANCGDAGENPWGHNEAEQEPVEEKPRKVAEIIEEEPDPEPIRIKRRDAMKLAMERYARGEITTQEYNEIMANL
jgi:hypothetical protein